MKTKVCSKCGEEKPVSEFYKCNKTKSGVSSYCKKCYCSQRKSRRLKTLEYDRERCRLYRINNKEKIKEKAKEYAIKNREKLNEKQKKYRKQEKVKKRELFAGKIYREKNREKLKIKKQERIEILSESYIKDKIARSTRIKYKDIPPELVELKRVQIQIHRELKKMDQS